jgi:glycosyltransferase involved in cell wall biosynthesis
VRWLAFGTYEVERHPRVAALIDGLRACGDQVVEVNEPLGLDTAARVRMLRQPWRVPVLAARLAVKWARLAVRGRRERRRHDPDAVLVGYLGHFDVRLARQVFRGLPIVLDHLVSAAGTAADRGLAGSGGIKHRLMRAIDDGALRSADVVVVDTAEHLDTLPQYARGRAVVAPVGATDAWFTAPAADGSTTALRVVFFGLFTPLQGTRTIGEALALLADDERITATMVGTGQDHAACRASAAVNPRVTWLDWVPGRDLPALVAGHDVCLGIFGTTDKAHRVVPTKVYQGAAAGCAVVTSDTPPQRAVLDGAAVLVPPGDPKALAEALRELAGDPAATARWRAAARERALERFTVTAVVGPLRDRVPEVGSGTTGSATNR